MRIALVIGDYHATGGGAERWTDRHARQLLARGHAVHVIARSFTGLPDDIQSHQVEIPRHLKRSPRLAFADRAEQIARELAADAVHDMGDGWHADLFMPHHGTRIGGFKQNSKLLPRHLQWTRPLAWKSLPRYREFAELERRQYAPQPGKRFIALSQFVARHMREHYAVPDSAIRIVPNGVDTAWFTPETSPRRRSLMRRKLGFDSAVIFLIVAHNFRLKGLDELLLAFANLANQNVALVVAGNGSDKKYSQIVSRLGIREKVRFVGSWPDPRPLYRAADVYVQPSYYDPCSLVALEALASGLPVITTSHNGAGELLTEGEHGYVISEPNDIDALTDRMNRLVEPDIRGRMSDQARSLACRWSQERNLATIESLYREPFEQRRAA